jgi:uncharacterized protein YlxW (UPF0749 family)
MSESTVNSEYWTNEAQEERRIRQLVGNAIEDFERRTSYNEVLLQHLVRLQREKNELTREVAELRAQVNRPQTIFELLDDLANKLAEMDAQLKSLAVKEMERPAQGS